MPWAVISAALLALFLGLPPSVGKAPSVAPAGAIVHLADIEARILDLVNRERSKASLPALRLDDALRAAARGQSDEMLTRGFFGHINPSGEGPGDRVARWHRRLIGVTAENIWELSGFDPAGYPDLGEEIMRSWMGSRGHRENILRKEFTHLGVGVSRDGREVRATQTFAAVRSLLSQPAPATVKRGAFINLSISDGDQAVMFDLWSREKGRTVLGPAPIAGARLDAPPGRYALRFYYARRPAGYIVYDGPAVEIR